MQAIICDCKKNSCLNGKNFRLAFTKPSRCAAAWRSHAILYDSVRLSDGFQIAFLFERLERAELFTAAASGLSVPQIVQTSSMTAAQPLPTTSSPTTGCIAPA